MVVSDSLAYDLSLLTDALDRRCADLKTVLGELAADMRVAVSSYLGLSMTMVVDFYPLTLTVFDDADVADIATSILLPLSAVSSAEAGSVLVLYAATPGAFVDFAADVGYALGVEVEVLELDEHLTAPSLPSGLTGLNDHSYVNRALGILIDRGHPSDVAREELQRTAWESGISVAALARLLVNACGATRAAMPSNNWT